MRKLVLKVLVLILAISYIAYSQDLDPEKKLANYKLESILKNLNSYRFGMISIYKLEDPMKIEAILRPYLSAGPTVTIDSTKIKGIVEKYGQEVYDFVCSESQLGTDLTQIIDDAFNKFNIFLSFDDVEMVSGICAPVATGTKIQSAYIITTRPKSIDDKGEIISLIVSKDNIGVEYDLSFQDEKSIFTFVELQQITDPDNQSRTLYDILDDYLSQGYVIPKTQDAQGQGRKDWFVRRQPGFTESLIKEEDVSGKDVQKIMRITDGDPLPMKEGKLNELIVSPDLISWRQYPWNEDWDPAETISNERLPKYGAELRYGVDAINMPSIWSERLTLSALWNSVRLGIVLPTAGWAETFTNMYSLNRKFTSAGLGIAANFDFPFPIVPQSGVFRANFSYVSGDATESDFKKPFNDLGTEDRNYDYLLRAHGQLHYTYAISVDRNFLLRLGLGATVYNMESWHFVNKSETDPNTGTETIVKKYLKASDETVGGISGRVDFMAINQITPYGASFQYFDDSILSKIWLQIPVIDNTLALGVSADIYFTLRNTADLHPWETESTTVAIPMVRLIYIF